MRVLITFISLIMIVSCSTELDRCIEANRSKVLDEYLLNSELEVVSNEKLKQQWIDDYESKISFEINDEGRNYLEDVKYGWFIMLRINSNTGLPYELHETITIEGVEGFDEFEQPTTTVGNLYKLIQTQLSIDDDMRTYNLFNMQRHLDYNREYYNLSLDSLLKEEATSKCHSQGIY